MSNTRETILVTNWYPGYHPAYQRLFLCDPVSTDCETRVKLRYSGLLGISSALDLTAPIPTRENTSGTAGKQTGRFVQMIRGKLKWIDKYLEDIRKIA